MERNQVEDVMALLYSHRKAASNAEAAAFLAIYDVTTHALKPILQVLPVPQRSGRVGSQPTRRNVARTNAWAIPARRDYGERYASHPQSLTSQMLRYWTGWPWSWSRMGPVVLCSAFGLAVGWGISTSS